MSIASPYELLKQLDLRFRKNASGLPVASDVVEDWLGIGFAINGIPLLAKMEDAGSTTNIIILDACRDNPFERSWRRSTHGSGLWPTWPKRRVRWPRTSIHIARSSTR